MRAKNGPLRQVGRIHIQSLWRIRGGSGFDFSYPFSGPCTTGHFLPLFLSVRDFEAGTDSALSDSNFLPVSQSCASS